MTDIHFIWERDNDIIAFRDVLMDAKKAYREELDQYGGDLSEETRDSWGTLLLNTEVIASQAQSLIALMRKNFPST